MFRETEADRPPALENKLRYLAAKLRQTGSSTSRTTDYPSFPLSFWERVELPVPISPVIENLIWSLLVSILMVSEREPYSRQMRLNSFDGRVQMELNSVSGLPKVSESRFMRDRLNSDILSPPIFVMGKLYVSIKI